MCRVNFKKLPFCVFHIFSTCAQCGFLYIAARNSTTLKLCELSTISVSTVYYYVFSRCFYEQGQISPQSRHKVVSDTGKRQTASGKRDAMLRLWRWRWRCRWRCQALLFNQAGQFQFHHVELPATVLHTLAPMATRVPKQWEHSTTDDPVQWCVCVTTIRVEVFACELSKGPGKATRNRS